MKCLLHNEGNVLSVQGALLWVVNVVSTDVGVLEGSAGGLYVKTDGKDRVGLVNVGCEVDKV